MNKFVHLFIVTLFSIKAFSGEPISAQSVYQTVVIGSGVGALTSAMYLARAGLHPFVIEGPNPGGALAQSPNVENWPGEIAIPGWQLVEKIRTQAEKSGAVLSPEILVDVDLSDRPFRLTLQNAHEPEKTRKITAHSLILAPGSKPTQLNVPGENKYWTKGLYSCAVCDGSLYQGKTVAVVGGGDAAITETLYLANIASKVHVFVRKGDFKSVEKERKELILKLPNVETHFFTSVEEILGDNEKVNSVVVKNHNGQKETIAIDGLFLAIGSLPNTEFLNRKIELDEKGYIVLKNQQQASIPGVFALGDSVDGVYRQAISAAGDGAKAALQAQEYLTKVHVQPKAVVKETNQQPVEKKKVIEIVEEKEFANLFDGKDGIIVVDFFADWCSPCRFLAPTFEKFAGESSANIRCYKLNVQKHSSLAQKYRIYSIPTVIVFNSKGQIISQKAGTGDILNLFKQLSAETNTSSEKIEKMLNSKR